jgi:hypothetical protein
MARAKSEGVMGEAEHENGNSTLWGDSEMARGAGFMKS